MLILFRLEAFAIYEILEIAPNSFSSVEAVNPKTGLMVRVLFKDTNPFSDKILTVINPCESSGNPVDMVLRYD